MSLNWLFAVLLLLVYANGFASEMQFNELIVETQTAQIQLAEEIKSQLNAQLENQKEKTLAGVTSQKRINLEGSYIEIF